VAVLCYTHGESSTLHGIEGDLDSVRAAELAGATRVLGVDPARLVDYPDGALTGADVDDLSAHVLDLAGEVGAVNPARFPHTHVIRRHDMPASKAPSAGTT
jgi:LmbE family N-acetylglucosaminyl deacetylase